jgi:hypothetical protein
VEFTLSLRFLLAFLILSILSLPVFAQTAGGSCSGTNKGQIYGNGTTLLLNCNGSTWDTLINTSTSTASGSTGYVQFNNAGALLGDSSLFWDNTNKRLGIGTTSPSTAVHLYGTDTSLSLSTAAGRTFKIENLDSLSTARFGTSTSHSLNILTNSTTRMTILNTGNIGIGSTVPVASLDLSQKTDALALPSGTTAQEPGSPVAGMLRYNSTLGKLEYYSGGAWLTFNASGAPPGSGYFVLSTGTYTGDLGSAANSGGNTGLAAGNAICLNELTTNTTWWGYASANAAGLLNSSHVFAFLCDGSTCNNLTASTNYYFANVGDSTAGGAYFTTNASGLGPNDSNRWISGNYWGGVGTIGTSTTPWTGRGASTNTVWLSTPSANTCTSWTSSSSGVQGTISQPNFSEIHRWGSANTGCNSTLRLICYVNP